MQHIYKFIKLSHLSLYIILQLRKVINTLLKGMRIQKQFCWNAKKMPQREVMACNRIHIGGLLEEEREEAERGAEREGGAGTGPWGPE